MLWTGIAIWLISVGISWAMAGDSAESTQTTLMELTKSSYQMMPVFTIVLLCVFGPVLEEFSFRLWGIGKEWAFILTVILMTVFCIGELGWWSVVLIALFITAYLVIKEPYKKQWALTLISTTIFTICHISGFGAFGIDMVVGLANIFGFALVLCWLTLNVGFVWSCLLHVINNSCAIVLPLLLTPDPTVATHTSADGHTVETSIAPQGLLPENKTTDTVTSRHWATYHGEPSEIAVTLINHMRAEQGMEAQEPYYQSVSRNTSLEERIIYTIGWDTHDAMTTQRKLDYFLKDFASYSGKPITFDTALVELMEIDWEEQSRSDGETLRLRLNINGTTFLNNYGFDVVQRQLEKDHYTLIAYGDTAARYYGIKTGKANPLLESAGIAEMQSHYAYFQNIEYTPTGRFVRLISVK